MIVLGVILGVVVLLGLWLMVSYNNLIRLREMVKCYGTNSSKC